MDESREYLKMCEEASEIQGRVFKPGDVAGSSFYCLQVLITKESLQRGRNEENLAWLPRIGQLIEMLDGNMAAMDKLWEVYKIAPSEYYQQFNFSMEQILLAIYMEEKHGKVWHGNTWKTKESA